MDELKRKIQLLSQEQQSHVHSIIGDAHCSRISSGVRFDLHKLPKDVLQNISNYLEAVVIVKRPKVVLRCDTSGDHVPVSRKRPDVLSVHQSQVKKRLKAKCKQRKPAKQDKACGKIDVAVASEFCDAVKTDNVGLDDDEADQYEFADGNDDELDYQGQADEPDDPDEPATIDEHNDCEEDGTTALPSYIAETPLAESYSHYRGCLLEAGFLC